MQSTTIAHVGAYKKFSEADSGRQVRCLVWLVNNDSNIRSFKHEVINLKYGRDFLLENKEYDIVILHSIFLYSIKNPQKQVMVSPEHSIENWKKRLIITNANYIFICEGQPCTLSGWKIGELVGYEIKHRDQLLTVYCKENKNERSF